jgi:glycerol-3-phosphate dehydrogenase subunit C
MKIARPVVRRVADSDADFYSSDCPMAGHQTESGLQGSQQQPPREPTHPLKLLRMAYGI